MAAGDTIFIIILILVILATIIGGIYFQRQQTNTGQRGIGGKCDTDIQCEQGLVCRQGLCEKPGITGGKCAANMPCPKGSYCGADNVCHVGLIPEPGLACVANSQCALGQYCNGFEQCDDGQPSGLNNPCFLASDCLVGQYCTYSTNVQEPDSVCSNGSFIQPSFSKNNIFHVNTSNDNVLLTIATTASNILFFDQVASNNELDWLWTYDNNNFTLQYNYGGSSSSQLQALNNNYAMISMNGTITLTPNIGQASEFYFINGPTTDNKVGFIRDQFGNILNISTQGSNSLAGFVAFTGPQYVNVPIGNPIQLDNYNIMAPPS